MVFIVLFAHIKLDSGSFKYTFLLSRRLVNDCRDPSVGWTALAKILETDDYAKCLTINFEEPLFFLLVF